MLISPATDGTAIEHVYPFDGVDATTSMGIIETTARSPKNIKTRQTVDYDQYHRAQPLSTLSAGDPVWVQYANSCRQGRHASFVSFTHPDDMSTKESTTSGADADPDT